MTTYRTLKKSLRPSRRIWAAIDNVRTAIECGIRDEISEHATALSALVRGFQSDGLGSAVFSEAQRALDEATKAVA